MSFESDVREELARIPCPDKTCAAAELSAALRCSGGITYRGRDRYSIALRASHALLIRRSFHMLKDFWGISGEILASHTEALGGRKHYQLNIPTEESLRILQDLKLTDPHGLFGLRDAPNVADFPSEPERQSLLKGAFLVCGTVSNPEKAYHLEFSAPNEPCAQFLMDAAASFRLPGHSVLRRARTVVYWKKAEEVSDLLTLLGASSAMLKLENVRIQKDMRGNINRQMNCDQSNIERAMRSAQRQTEDIRYLMENVGLMHLPPPLREVASLRLEHPDASYSELGALCTPPIGKSGLRTRMDRIGELAEKLRCGEDTSLE